MRTNSRITKINNGILVETANIIRGELHDPRIGKMTTVVKVETTSDLKYCKIFVSIFGNDAERKEVMTGLKSASGFIRKKLAETINLRNTPELKFELDDSLENSMRIAKLIDEINKK